MPRKETSKRTNKWEKGRKNESRYNWCIYRRWKTVEKKWEEQQREIRKGPPIQLSDHLVSSYYLYGSCGDPHSDKSWVQLLGSQGVWTYIILVLHEGIWNGPMVSIFLPAFDVTGSMDFSYESCGLSPWFHPGWLPPISMWGIRRLS